MSEHLHLVLEELSVPEEDHSCKTEHLCENLCTVSDCHVSLQKEKQQCHILGWIPFKGRIQTCENNHSLDMWLIEIQTFSIRGD